MQLNSFPAVRNFLRLPQVIRLTGLAKSTIYRLAACGDFPAQVKLGPRTSAWVADEVERWIADRIASRDAVRAAA